MRNKIRALPEKPGCYVYRNSEGTVIYVGKAKNLKNRVRTYFHSPDTLLPKTRIMISEAENIEYYVTDSETEAFMLETNLIKQYRPRYNILMKDDKSYPYIKLTENEAYPRLHLTRKRGFKDGSYFGPYLNAYAARKTIDAVLRFYPMKKCEKKVALNKTVGKVCLNYHLGLCPGVCSGKISQEEYRKTVDEVKKILSGNYAVLSEKLEQAMNEQAEKLNFESAMIFKELRNCVNTLFEKQKINSGALDERDIIGLYRENEMLCAVIFNIREGKLVNTTTRYLSGVNIESEDSEAFLSQYYSSGIYIPSEIVLAEPSKNTVSVSVMLSSLRGGKVCIVTAQRGDKKRLLDMAQKNAELAVQTRKSEEKRRQEAFTAALGEIRDVLGMEKTPHRIEAYDISNISGSENVGVMVVYENGKKNASAMRKFRIKYVSGVDDYASTAEMVFRRLSRADSEKAEKSENPKFLPLPELIFADGGIAHVNVIAPICADFSTDITVAGLVKDSRHRLRGVITSAGEEIPIEQFRYAKALLNEISEEVHEKAVGYHRQSRSKKMIASSLTEIDGIGEKRAVSLLKTFGSIEKLAASAVSDIAKADGMNLKSAKAVKEALTNIKQ